MKLMLDTHALIWWLRDNPKLGPKARDIIANPRNEVLVSIASFWEISIKRRIGKIEERGSQVLDESAVEGCHVVEINQAHLKLVESLPRFSDHNDPFDHLIVAQVQEQQAILMTVDRHLARYGIRCVDCG
jgi:PIN domain nuclease of toxin-antitoxin system